MTGQETINELQSNSKLNQARRIFSGTHGLIDQRMAQGMSPVEMRKMEFEAVEKILALWDIDPRKET